jgi:hypothetical protein
LGCGIEEKARKGGSIGHGAWRKTAGRLQLTAGREQEKTFDRITHSVQREYILIAEINKVSSVTTALVQSNALVLTGEKSIQFFFHNWHLFSQFMDCIS